MPLAVGISRFDPLTPSAYSYAPCCGTDELGRTASSRSSPHLGRFDRARVNGLDLAVCPENRS